MILQNSQDPTVNREKSFFSHFHLTSLSSPTKKNDLSRTNWNKLKLVLFFVVNNESLVLVFESLRAVQHKAHVSTRAIHIETGSTFPAWCPCPDGLYVFQQNHTFPPLSTHLVCSKCWCCPSIGPFIKFTNPTGRLLLWWVSVLAQNPAFRFWRVSSCVQSFFCNQNCPILCFILSSWLLQFFLWQAHRLSALSHTHTHTQTYTRSVCQMHVISSPPWCCYMQTSWFFFVFPFFVNLLFSPFTPAASYTT